MTLKNNTNNKRSPKPDKPVRKQRKQKRNNFEPLQKRGMLVVGIGASAGGLKPLQSFFEYMPADTGLAFVVVTHLHPEHESHLDEILQTKTGMPVTQVTNLVPIEPNHIYVISPNRNISVTDSHLETSEFSEPRGYRAPIDGFFRSLAKAHQGAVAVILSGSGTDGSLGVKDIKQDGGLLLVQHPDEAEYDGMPNAAIQTGLADVVLPVRDLVERLVKYTKQVPQLPDDEEDLTEQDLKIVQRILAQVHARTGHDFSHYKRSTILRRMQRRMQINGLATLDAYYTYMHGNASEATAIFSDILINVTNFFRDRTSWEALAEKVIPDLFENKTPGEGIRTWSIGCATGEEAYSLAILLLEQAEKLKQHYEIQVFASDLDDMSLLQAREGIYPSAIAADVSPERLEQFFTRHGADHYQVKRELRDVVLFTNHSILRDPPFLRLDLITCRNVLIYLQRQVQDTIFETFHYSLNPGGHLFLGNSESAEQADQLFHVIDKPHRLYQARPWRRERPHVPPLPPNTRHMPRANVRIALRPTFPLKLEESPPLEQQHKEALELYGPPSVLIDEDYNILHISETAGRYLLQRKGTITGEVLKLVRPELHLELRAALFQAFEKEKAVVSKPVLVQFNGHPHLVVLSVRPRKSHADAQKLALVVFLEDEIDAETIKGSEAEKTAGAVEIKDQARSNALMVQLEAEVQRLREQLQDTVEEFDSSKEEMKAANEELQSINEEYRSTTEELETSKEELQSVNEELQTVNSELKEKLDEISRAHSDLENLMTSAELATLFLDPELRIRRYTPPLNAVFNIMPSDHGRPVTHLTHKLAYGELIEDVRQVLQKPETIEREVRGQEGEWFYARVRPYRTLDNKIDGVVITFLDITRIKTAEEALRKMTAELEERVKQRTQEANEAHQRLSQTRDQFYALFHANPIPTALTRLDNALFLDVNEAYLKYYEVERQHVIGHTAEELNLPLTPDEQAQVLARLQKEGVIRNLELQIRHPSRGTRTILLSLQPIKFEGAEAVIATSTDITERVHTEQQVRTVASSLTAAEQVERHRISRVLHDDLQQHIFAVKMQLAFLGEAIEKNDFEGLKLDLSQLDNWLTQAIATTRQLSVDLSPPILHGEGLVEAVIWLASQMKEQYGLEVGVQTNGVNPAFEEDVRVLIFQSLRELLFNVVKHAGTLRANLTFEQRDGTARITVSDGGKGFDSEVMMREEKTAHGLSRMRDRLFLLGCVLKVKSESNQGTYITVEAPVKDIMD